MEAITAHCPGANNKLLMCGNPTKHPALFDAFHADRAQYKYILRYRRGTIRGLRRKEYCVSRSEIWQGQQCCARACGQ